MHFHNPARVVEIKPDLNFSSPDAKNVEHYQSACRFGLLAYVAFPNREWRTVSELMGLPGATCEALFSAFVSEDPRPSLPPPAEQWGGMPFLSPVEVGSCKGEGDTGWESGTP